MKVVTNENLGMLVHIRFKRKFQVREVNNVDHPAVKFQDLSKLATETIHIQHTYTRRYLSTGRKKIRILLQTD